MLMTHHQKKMNDESSHSVQENSKESPPKSGIFVDQPPAEDESNHSVHEYSKGGVHASDEDSTGASYCGCKTRTCVSRQQKPSDAELSCLSSEEETGISSGVKVTNCFDIQRSTEFIQCLNAAGMHWITIATVGCTHGTVRVYDSLNKKLTKSLKTTVADILHSSTKKIEVEYVNVQYQLGSDDCGLFAIANACEICFSRDPSVVKYTQKDMWKHLWCSLQEQQDVILAGAYGKMPLLKPLCGLKKAELQKELRTRGIKTPDKITKKELEADLQGILHVGLLEFQHF
eukprot:Em0001g1948a